MGRNPQPLIDTFLRNEIPAWSRRFSESSHPDGYSFSYATSSIQLCAILFQRSPNHILTVELYLHRLVVVQIDHRTIFYIALVCIFHIAVDMIQFVRRSKKLLTKRKCCIYAHKNRILFQKGQYALSPRISIIWKLFLIFSIFCFRFSYKIRGCCKIKTR